MSQLFRILSLLSAVATLAFVGWSVRSQEQIIATGSPAYLALAPRDPRSLLQGDYMVLRYARPRTPIDTDGNELELTLPRKLPDSYFFSDGSAEKYEAARYALYSVTNDGRATLVALADENFVALDRFRAPSAR